MTRLILEETKYIIVFCRYMSLLGILISVTDLIFKVLNTY